MARMSPAEARAKRKQIETDRPVLAMMPTGRGGGRISPTNPQAETTHEAYRGAKWTVEQVRRVIKEHHSNADEFFGEAGKRSVYSAKKVLDWLGY